VQVDKDDSEGMLETFSLQAHYLEKVSSSGIQLETTSQTGWKSGYL